MAKLGYVKRFLPELIWKYKRETTTSDRNSALLHQRRQEQESF